MTPWESLADDLADGKTNIYAIPSGQLVAPGIAIYPASPWLSRSDRGFGYMAEDYFATPFVGVGDLAAGRKTLHRLVHHIVDHAGEGWEVGEVMQPRIDESTGTPLLASPVRLTYRSCTGDDE